MKKFFIALSLILFVMISSVFGILFTKPGNDLIASYIENTVNSQKKDVNFQVNNLELTFNTINFNATIDNNSIIDIKGDLQLFSKTVDLKYNIDIKDLSKLEPLVGQKLNGVFSSSGTFKGDAKSSIIDGISNLANSETKYNLHLVDFEPNNITFSMKHGKIDELLYLINQPKFAEGVLDINANIKNAKPQNLEGMIVSSITNGKVNNDIVNQEFKQNLSIPITFKTRTNAILKPNTITAKSTLISSIASVVSEETTVLIDQSKVTSNYKLNIPDLSKLESIVGIKLNGIFETSGTAVINNGIIKIDGDSSIFESLAKYSVKVQNTVPKYVKFDLTNAKLEKILYTINQPMYANAKIDIVGDIKNADIKNLDGVIKTRITDGKVINKIVNKQFEQKLKDKITFQGEVNTKLVKTQALSDAKIISSIANLDIKKAIFDISNLSLNSDYLVKISDLSKLYDVTQTKMRGKVDLSGEMKSSAENLLVTGASKLLGGNVDFKLNNNNFNANVNGIEIKQLTHMLYYPEVFDSTSKLVLDYNLENKKGNLKGNLIKGRFLPNDFSSIINQFSKFDLTREIYESVDINSDINDMVLKSIISMKSKNTQIDVYKSLLDLNKSYINSDIKAKVKEATFDFSVKGNMTSPKVKLNTSNLLKNKIEEKINKQIGDKLKNKLGDEGAKQLLNNFKSLF